MNEAGTSAESMRILIIGGYGVFGGRLAQLLADEPRLTLIIAGRSASRAADFCAELRARARLVAQAFDRDGDLDDQFRTLDPDIVVDASGPFQNYGTNRYRVVEAALAHGIHYMDLADASQFVAGIEAYDGEARQRDLAVLSGVSSFPVLTAAVVRHLAGDLSRVHTITAGIAPSPYAGIGHNVIRAVAGYAGKPVTLTRNGAAGFGYGLTETARETIAPPGQLPLGSRLFSLVDVPDLRVLPQAWPSLKSIWTGAAPVPEILHRLLIGLAWFARIRILPSLTPAAGLFHRATNTVRWGEHRGGMFVRVTGAATDGSTVSRSWHMLAECEDGPLIPSMAVAALVAKFLNRERPASGARSAVCELDLNDYRSMFSARTICDGVRDDDADNNTQLPIYQRVLGQSWHELPPQIRDMHVVDQHLVAHGTADIDRGRGPLVAAIGWLFGFPKPGRNVPLKVTFAFDGRRETWTRHFGAQRFRSIQQPGRGRNRYLMEERFGPITVGLALVVTPGRLSLVVRRWTFLGMPLPLALAPTGDTYESVEDDCFRFHVEIRAPMIGLLATYRGHLVPQSQRDRVQQGDRAR